MRSVSCRTRSAPRSLATSETGEMGRSGSTGLGKAVGSLRLRMLLKTSGLVTFGASDDFEHRAFDYFARTYFITSL